MRIFEVHKLAIPPGGILPEPIGEAVVFADGRCAFSVGVECDVKPSLAAAEADAPSWVFLEAPR